MKRILIIILLVIPLGLFGQLDTINVGSSANNGTGESLRSAMLKTNRVIKRLNILELHNVTSAIQTQLNAKAPLASPAFTGTPTVATTINPDANDGATLGTSGTGFSDLFLASGAVIDFNAGQASIAHTSDQEEIVVTADMKVTGRIEPGSIYVTSTGADISQTELDALDGVTGGEVMTTESLTDVVFITVGDTTVTAVVGKIVFKTSNAHFYGCVATTGLKWKQLDN